MIKFKEFKYKSDLQIWLNRNYDIVTIIAISDLTVWYKDHDVKVEQVLLQEAQLN